MISFKPIIAHVDMDAFFASIEIRNNPHLKGKPVIVGGGLEGRGVVSTCSYEARKFGVKSGMSSLKAHKLCPTGIFISSGLRGYVYASACMQKIFEKYSPIVQPCSVDESFLDITGSSNLFGGALELIGAMKQEMKNELGLTCSVGISPSKYLAKLASGLNKPDGVTVMDREKFKEIFYPKPVDSLWGIGESTRKSLNRRKIFTVSDLARVDARRLKSIFGVIGEDISNHSQGLGDARVHRFKDLPHDKSMSHETTLRKDIQDPSLIKATILWLSDKVSRRMRKRGYIGKTISVKVRSSDFETITRAYSLKYYTDKCDVIFTNALKLVPPEYGMKTRVRLLGVRMSNLKKISPDDRDGKGANLSDRSSEQLELLEYPGEKESEKLINAVDSIRDKYGEQIIKFAGTMLH